MNRNCGYPKSFSIIIYIFLKVKKKTFKSIINA